MKLQNIHAPWNPGFWRIQNLTFMASNIPIFRLLPVILIQLRKNTILFFSKCSSMMSPSFLHFVFNLFTFRSFFCDKHTEVHESPLWQPSSLNAKKRHGVQRPSWCIWSMAKRGTGTARGTGATPVKFSVSGMVIPATDDPQLIPSGTWSSRDGFFFFGLENGKPQKSHCAFFWAKRILLGAEQMKAKLFCWWCRNDGVFFAKTSLMGSWNQDPGFFEKYWNTSQSNADWNHCLRQEYLRWFHLMD